MTNENVKKTLNDYVGFDIIANETSNYIKKNGDVYQLTTGRDGRLLIQWDVRNKTFDISTSVFTQHVRSNASVSIYGVKAEATQLKLDLFIKYVVNNLMNNDYVLNKTLPSVDENETIKKASLKADELF